MKFRQSTDRELGDERARPSDHDLEVRVVEFVDSFSEMPDENRNINYMRALNELQNLLREIEKESYLSPEYDRNYHEVSLDERRHRRKEHQHFLNFEHDYPGYTIDDFRRYIKLLPLGISD